MSFLVNILNDGRAHRIILGNVFILSYKLGDSKCHNINKWNFYKKESDNKLFILEFQLYNHCELCIQ